MTSIARFSFLPVRPAERGDHDGGVVQDGASGPRWIAFGLVATLLLASGMLGDPFLQSLVPALAALALTWALDPPEERRGGVEPAR